MREIERDECGMRPDDHRWLLWEMEREDLRQRWKALKALWGKPIKARPRRGEWTIYDGYERNRDDEWSLSCALLASIAILINRRGSDYRSSVNLAFWDARDTYGGYEIWRLTLSAGMRVEIFSDGEFFL